MKEGIKPIGRGGFVRHFAMMEQAALTMLSGASLMAGLPLMANGANLLISRQEEIKAYPWEGNHREMISSFAKGTW